MKITDVATETPYSYDMEKEHLISHGIDEAVERALPENTYGFLPWSSR